MDNEVNEKIAEQAFTSIFNALDLKQQRKALRKAMRKEGNRVKRITIEELLSTPIGRGTNEDISKGIYLRVYPQRYGTGFMVSIRPKGKRGIHLNRQGLKKPILMWAEEGTEQRHTGRRTTSFFGINRYTGKRSRNYKRDGANRGRMPAYRFLSSSFNRVGDSVENNLFDVFQNNLVKEIEKG